MTDRGDAMQWCAMGRDRQDGNGDRRQPPSGPRPEEPADTRGHRAPIGRAFVSFATTILVVFAVAAFEPHFDHPLIGDAERAERLGLVGATVFGVAAALTANRAIVASSTSLMSIAAILGAGAGWSWTTFATGPVAGTITTTAATAIAAVLAVLLLSEGLWRARWLGVFCGLGAVGMTLATTMAGRGLQATGSTPLALLVAVSAMTCLYGILVEVEVGEQRTDRQLRAAKRRIESEIDRNEEVLHDLRSGLLSIEAAIATVDSDLAPPLQAEAARLRELTLPADTAAGAGDGFDLIPELSAMVTARQAGGQVVELRAPSSLWVTGRQGDVLAIVENLLSNAFRHGRAPVLVEVEPAMMADDRVSPGPSHHAELARRPAPATITVSDGGGRLPVPALSRRHERTISTHPLGQGLGLVRARRLAAGNGGRITAGLTPEGRTAFTLTLAVARPTVGGEPRLIP